MTRKYLAAGACLAAVLALAIAPRSLAQAAPAATTTTTTATTTAVTTTTTGESEEVIRLNPYVVEASEDKGYQATATLAGTRVRTDLKDVASSISVVTEQFLKDTGAKNSSDLLVYTQSTEVSGIRGNYSGVATTGIYQENTISQTTRVRGLDQADNTRDYFLTDIPWDGFNVGRVDLQRGPNSVLFGTGSPAGIINTSLNDATFKTAYHFENRIDQFGSMRNEVDLNQNIVPGVLSIRVVLLKDDELYEQKPAFNNSDRHYAALRFDPKLFSESSHTSLRVKYEDGKINSNNPRSVPPDDRYHRWFQTGVDDWGNPGYNKIILNAFNPAQVFNGVAYPGGIGGTLSNGLALANQGRSFWPDIINYYEGTPLAINKAVNPAGNFAYPSGTPIKTIAAQPNTDLGVHVNTNGVLDQAGGTLGAVNQPFLPRAIPMMSAWAPFVGKTAGFPGFSGNTSISSVPGAVYYANIVLRDPSVFNFYDKLLDGPNKHEWQKWKAFNVTLDQTFFNDRLGIQVAFDHQNYVGGAEQWMTGENYNIGIDVNATYADGTPNPNAGRPYAGNGTSAPGLNYEITTARDTFRVTPTYELHFSDLLGDTPLAKILGKHVFTGLFERTAVTKTYVNFAEFAANPSWMLDNRRNNASYVPTTGQLGSDRSFEWIVYLGPDQTGNLTAKNANLTNIKDVIAPPTSQTTWNFNARWNRPTTPGAPGYVDPTAPFSWISPVQNIVYNGFQSDNPVNYIGWQQEPVNWMYASDPKDYPSLVQSANRTRFTDNSRGITWQAFFLGGDLVPTYGWRKDVITSYQSNAKTDPISGFTSTSFPDDLGSRQDVRGESKTWGIVYHLPKALKLPGDSTISLFYDKGVNFKADASRLSMAGLPIPNAQGKTEEYGINITTLRDKLTLRITKFKTKVIGATLGETQGNSIGGLGQNAYFIADGSIWGYGWATYLQDAAANNGAGSHGASLSTYGDFASQDGFNNNTPANAAAALQYNLYGGTGTHGYYPGAYAVTDAWLHAPFPASFFASYNLSPNIVPTLGQATGHLRDSYPDGYNDAGGPQPGGGSSFGNHQTTVDNLSDGTEVELTYQPVKNWNITINYAKTKATHQNIDPVSIKFMSELTGFMNGPGGQIREWWNGDTGYLQGQWNSSLVAPYALFMNQLGHEAPEVSPWRINLISTYTFDHGAAKGVFVGGAIRGDAGRIIGYKFNSTIRNNISSDPNYANVVFLTLGGLDVNQEFRGKNEWHFDAWVGYGRKITRTIDWRIAVNVRNVAEHDRLYASRINPDGNIALARISEGMGWQLTNTFDF